MSAIGLHNKYINVKYICPKNCPKLHMATFKVELFDARKDETSLRYVINYKGKRLRYQLGLTVPVVKWHHGDEQVKPLKDYEVLNKNIVLRTAVCKSVFLKEYDKAAADNKVVDPDHLKVMMDEALERKPKNQKETNPFYKFVDGFIKQAQSREMTTIKRNRTSNIYKQTLARLKDFETVHRYPVRFGSINMMFYNKYLAYCAGKKLMLNTVGRDIKCIRTWMNAALRDKITRENGHLHRDFKELATDVDTIYLNDQEIKAIIKVKLTDTVLDACRFWWVAGSYTGLRISDWSKVTKKAIESGMLDLIPQKTKDRVAIAIHPEFKKFVTKYKELPYIPAEPIINRKIKLICGMAEIIEPVTIKEYFVDKVVNRTVRKCDLVASHTARRSFATNLYLAGFPAIGIMKITGHKTEKAFMKYIRITPRDTADQLAAFWKAAARGKR